MSFSSHTSSRKALRFSFLLTVVAMFATGLTRAQTGIITGTVVEASSGEALTGVNVGLAGTTLGAATNAAGRFIISGVPAETYTIQASLVGYLAAERTIRVRADEITELEVALSQQAVELSGITVTGRRVGYVAEDVMSVDVAEEGERPTQVRERMASLWADYTFQDRLLKGLGIGAGVRYLGPSYGDVPNTLKAPAATLADATIHYDWQHLRVQVNANNVLDNKHVASTFVSGPQDFATYGAERTMTVSIRYRW